VPYLEHKTPLKYYSQANIGSRPAKRGKKQELQFGDLRAIPFVGSWSQMKQNVPGYFGLGTALNNMAKEGKQGELKKLFNDAPFFKALIMNSMMSLSKCNFAITRHIGDDPVYGEFWRLIYEEYRLTEEMVFAISGYAELMQEEPVTKKSIEIREQIVLPLLLIQQYAMQQVENGSSLKKNYEKLISRSIYGIINASRNSI
jgi:phosphoenolpyruvate carboxylase